ncbi:MAG: DUF6090 family protein [Balneolaceae bacterium]|nr:DUF6090 family protein [Balneolaceae bacterium]
MIRFFKKLRLQFLTGNKIRKYLLYAIGEIILVVIGILIALQINNWNTQNSQQTEIREIAQSLVNDLEEDIVMFQARRDQMVQIISRLDSLSTYVAGKDIENISNIDFICLTWNLLYMPLNWNRATLDQMKNSGSLHFIKNSDLIKKISSYDALTRHLDEDYLNDKAKSENAIQLINKVTNNNYPNMNQLRENVFLKINNLEYDEFWMFSEPEYNRAKEYQLKLISTDINEVREAINSLTRLQFHYTIRTEAEAARLEQSAQEIISILKEMYFD